MVLEWKLATLRVNDVSMTLIITKFEIHDRIEVLYENLLLSEMILSST